MAHRTAGVPPDGEGVAGSAVVAAKPPGSAGVFGFQDGTLVALTAFIRKTQTTPDAELAVAYQRLQEVTE